MHHPTDRMTHTTVFVTPVVEHWLEREISQWVADVKQCYNFITFPIFYISILQTFCHNYATD